MGQNVRPSPKADTTSLLLGWLEKNNKIFQASDVMERFGVSRQTASRVLSSLVHRGVLTKSGSTRNARYKRNTAKARTESRNSVHYKRKLVGLQEDRVFGEIAQELQLKNRVTDSVFRILYYAFTEMLNNAIDHSQSVSADIQFQISTSDIRFRIEDTGIGAFENIRRTFRLASEYDAIGQLLKGKQTTSPANHSGQGIFFTSKIADHFSLRSGASSLRVDNLLGDIFAGQQSRIKGTRVEFTLATKSKKSLKTLFDEYSNDDFEFDRTVYPVVVLKQDDVISRSQAKRLTMGLEKFKRITLDFKNVDELGQGFADEVFRVFQRQHPSLVIESINANPAVHMLIQRAIRG